MNNPWQLYDDLIDLIPPGTKVRDARIGNWACATSDTGTGVAMIYRGGPRAGFAERDMVGRDLRDAASAINSFLTAEERVSANLTPGEDERSTFERHAETRPDLRIATIGHFGDIEKYAEGRDLIVLERSPSGNDLPDPAAEYLLADRELVFITGSALTNKTLPRLLELCSGARVILVGPSAPFAPEVLPACVAEIGGSLVIDPDHVRRAIGLGGGMAEARQGLRMFNHIIRRNP